MLHFYLNNMRANEPFVRWSFYEPFDGCSRLIHAGGGGGGGGGGFTITEK